MAILGYNNKKLFIREFGLAEWLKTRGLAGWLEIATDGLAEPAKQRIAYEIGAHYAEAVSVHLEEGEPESSAQSMALAELGDPQKAALNFRKSHLTECEAKSMKSMEWIASKPFFSFWGLLLDAMPLAWAAFLFFYSHESRAFTRRPFFAVLVLVSYIGFRLIPRLLSARVMPSRRSSLFRQIVLCQSITNAVVLPAFWLVGFTPDHDRFSVFNTIFLTYLYGFACNPWFQVWKKLRKMDDDRKDLPPWKTTAT